MHDHDLPGMTSHLQKHAYVSTWHLGNPLLQGAHGIQSRRSQLHTTPRKPRMMPQMSKWAQVQLARRGTIPDLHCRY